MAGALRYRADCNGIKWWPRWRRSMTENTTIAAMPLYTNLDRVARGLSALGIGPIDPIPPERLFALDQWHYHGTEAIRAAAKRLGLGSSSRVARYRLRSRRSRTLLGVPVRLPCDGAGASACAPYDRRRPHATQRPRRTRHAHLRRRAHLCLSGCSIRRRGQLACVSSHSGPPPSV